MTAVGLPPRRLVRVAVQAPAGIAVGTPDRQVAFAGELETERAVMVAEEEPRAVALQVQEPFGMAFQGKRLFTAVGGRQGPPGPPGKDAAGTAPIISTDPDNRLTQGADAGLYVRDDLTPDPLAYYILAKG